MSLDIENLIEQIKQIMATGGPIEAMRSEERAQGFQIVLPGEAPWLSADDWPDHITISTNGRMVRIIAIIANHPGQGAFSRLVKAIVSAGLEPVVVSPFSTMRAILTRWNWTNNDNDEWSRPAEEKALDATMDEENRGGD